MESEKSSEFRERGSIFKQMAEMKKKIQLVEVNYSGAGALFYYLCQIPALESINETGLLLSKAYFKGERKAVFEDCESEKQENKEKIKKLKEEVKQLQVSINFRFRSIAGNDNPTGFYFVERPFGG